MSDGAICVCARTLAEMPQLRELSFAHNACADDGAAAVAAALSFLPRMRTVDASHNAIGAEGCAAIAGARACGLRREGAAGDAPRSVRAWQLGAASTRRVTWVPRRRR